MPRKPIVRPARPADTYAMPGERIAEFHDAKSGGLISVRRHPDGHLLVQLYNLDADVQVTVPAANLLIQELS